MSELNGCGGRLCRALRWRSKKFDCVRYAENGFGGIDTEQTELSYKICGKIYSRISQSSSNQTDIPGRSVGQYSSSLELIVIMSSDDIMTGDIIFDGEYQYRIIGRICDSPVKFGLERIELPNIDQSKT